MKKDSQHLRLVPNPCRRGKGWVRLYDLVLIVEVKDYDVSILTGHIESWPGSHVGTEDGKTVIVWGYKPFNPQADSLDDQHERGFSVTDPNLLKVGEAEVLKGLPRAREWFGGIYQDAILQLIVKAMNDRVVTAAL